MATSAYSCSYLDRSRYFLYQFIFWFWQIVQGQYLPPKKEAKPLQTYATDAAQPHPVHRVSVMSLLLSPRQRSRHPFCYVAVAQRSVVTTMVQMTPHCSCKATLHSFPLLLPPLFNSLCQISLCNRNSQDYIMLTRL